LIVVFKPQALDVVRLEGFFIGLGLGAWGLGLYRRRKKCAAFALSAPLHIFIAYYDYLFYI
jgi:hypothetical protein